MKKTFVVFLLLNTIFSLNLIVKAQDYTLDVTLDNFTQVNENRFEFDVLYKNTSAQTIGFYGIQTNILFNLDIFNDGSGATVDYSRSFGMVPGSSELTGDYEVINGEKVEAGATANGIVIITNEFTTYTWPIVHALEPGESFRLVRMFVQFVTPASGPASQKKYRKLNEVLPNLVFHPIILPAIARAATLYYDEIEQVYYADTDGNPDWYAIPYENNSRINNLPNDKELKGYNFTGTGSWSTTTLWNNALSDGMPGKNALPGSTNNAMINGTCTQDAHYTVSDLLVKTDGSLTLQPGKQLTVSGILENEAGTSDKLVLQGDVTGSASLMNATAGIKATVQRYVTAWTDVYHGWHFLSSPVLNQPIQPGFVPNPPNDQQDFYKWDEASATWINSKTVDMNWNPAFESSFGLGRGYLVAYAAGQVLTFDGEVNAAEITLPLTRQSSEYTAGWNLIGNPYPCGLLWNDGSYTLSNVNGLAKVWNEVNASYSDINPGSAVPMCQGLMVEVASGASSGSVTIPTGAKTHTSIPWYKVSDYQALKLTVWNKGNMTGQEHLVRYQPGATSGFDTQMDAHFIWGYGPGLLSMIGDEPFSTNSLPESSIDEPYLMWFYPNKGTEFELNFDGIGTFSQATPLHLLDIKENRLINIRENPVYSFTGSNGDDPKRFLLYTSTVGIPESLSQQNPVLVFGNKITILDKEIRQVEVYNAAGQLVQNHLVSASQVSPQLVINQSGVFVLRLIKEQGAVSIKKVIIH